MSRLQLRVERPLLPLTAFALMACGREELYRRIDARLDTMLAAGFLAEVQALRSRDDLDPDLPSLRAVGYRQLWAHLAGDLPWPAAVAAAKRATRNLAKRQLTWLRSEAGLLWIGGLEDQELAPIREAIDRAVPDGGARSLC